MGTVGTEVSDKVKLHRQILMKKGYKLSQIICNTDTHCMWQTPTLCDRQKTVCDRHRLQWHSLKI